MNAASWIDELPATLQPLGKWAATERLGGSTRLTQSRIDAFADATGDHNWIHVDPTRAQAGLPAGRPSPMDFSCSPSPSKTMWRR